MSRIVSGFIFLVFSPAASARNLPSVAKDEKNKDWHSGYQKSFIYNSTEHFVWLIWMNF